jgi:hypothetical protein
MTRPTGTRGREYDAGRSLLSSQGAMPRMRLCERRGRGLLVPRCINSRTRLALRPATAQRRKCRTPQVDSRPQNNDGAKRASASAQPDPMPPIPALDVSTAICTPLQDSEAQDYRLRWPLGAAAGELLAAGCAAAARPARLLEERRAATPSIAEKGGGLRVASTAAGRKLIATSRRFNPLPARRRPAVPFCAPAFRASLAGDGQG